MWTAGLGVEKRKMSSIDSTSPILQLLPAEEKAGFLGDWQLPVAMIGRYVYVCAARGRQLQISL